MKNNKKKIAIIGTNGIPARYGGFETLSEYLTKELGEIFEFTVYCSRVYKKEERIKFYNNSRLIYLPFNANGFQSIFYDIFSTFHALLKSDLLLILGPAAGFILPFNKFFKKKIITNHGGLNEWERKKLSFLQRNYAYINHKIAGLSSSENIADNKPLKKSLNNTFGIGAKVIEYGGDHVSKEKISEEYLIKYPFLGKPYHLCIARAQIDNNLHMLIDTYKNISEKSLVIISNWNVSSYGNELYRKYHNYSKNIILINAVYKKLDLDIIRSNTELYIHSHSQCGTSPSLVEAMNYEIPIISFDVETNRETTQNKSYYFNDCTGLEFLIRNLSKSDLNKLKNEMFFIAKKSYTWKNISKKYSTLFNKSLISN